MLKFDLKSSFCSQDNKIFALIFWSERQIVVSLFFCKLDIYLYYLNLNYKYIFNIFIYCAAFIFECSVLFLFVFFIFSLLVFMSCVHYITEKKQPWLTNSYNTHIAHYLTK